MQRTRIYGPYRDEKRGSWTVVTVEPPDEGEDEGARSARRFTGQKAEEEAHRYRDELEEELKLEGPITVEAALEEYERHLVAKGNKPGTVATTMRRLRSLMGAGTRRLVQLSGGAVAAEYAAYVVRGTGEPVPGRPLSAPQGRPVAVDTHRNTLGEARTFGKWAAKMGHLRRNPWVGIEATGRRRKGKKQLRVDEARRFVAKCLELGDDGAVAALCCLLLGLRASEVIDRVGRDIDDGGRLLWIGRSKTDAGVRHLEVPELLRPILADRSTQGRPDQNLFDHSRYWLRDQVRRICKLAGVPVVCPHGLRGTHASLAMAAGSSSALVAASMGHSPEVMLAHYAQPGAVSAGAQERLLKVLAGGRK